MRVLSATQMREVDRKAIEEVGIPLVALMENAGRAVARAALAELAPAGSRAPLLVCGRGNNGGDGLVAARHLASAGATPRVLLLGLVDELRSEVVRDQARAVRNLGIPLLEAPDPERLHAAPAGWDAAPVVVDAIFGTGFRPPARGVEAAAIERIRAARARGARVLAVDLPSGLDADSPRVTPPVVSAHRTVTFAAPKLAHLLAPAEDHVGDLEVADITIPAWLLEVPEHQVELVEASRLRGLLPPRPRGSHKGSYGHLLVVAGSVGKTGAAQLVARAALRAGAGLVTVATPASALPMVSAGAPEVMTAPLPETPLGTLAAAAEKPLLELLGERDALALGPGLGTGPETQALVRSLLPRVPVPGVVDADGLNSLAGGPPVPLPASRLVLTPHPGEASRLLGRPTAAVNEDRIPSARELARSRGAVAVLKGHRSVTAHPDGRAFLNSTGNPGLASAGTGDALTGVIGGLLAQGLPPLDAALLGVWLHGLAGDLGARERGQAALIAGDVIEALGPAFLDLERGSAGSTP